MTRPRVQNAVPDLALHTPGIVRMVRRHVRSAEGRVEPGAGDRGRRYLTEAVLVAVQDVGKQVYAVGKIVTDLGARARALPVDVHHVELVPVERALGLAGPFRPCSDIRYQRVRVAGWVGMHRERVIPEKTAR